MTQTPWVRKLVRSLWEAAIAGGMAALPAFAAGGDPRVIVAAFLGPAIGWLALRYEVHVQRAMNASPVGE